MEPLCVPDVGLQPDEFLLPAVVLGEQVLGTTAVLPAGFLGFTVVKISLCKKRLILINELLL